MVAHTYNPIQDAEAKGSGVQSQHELYSEFKIINYMKHYLAKQNKTPKEAEKTRGGQGHPSTTNPSAQHTHSIH